MTLQAQAGSDAAAFLIDMASMYQQYAHRHSWITQTHLRHQTMQLEAIISITGQGIYPRLRFEQGAHRVQRVPVTDPQGRVKTSLVQVFVRPAPPAPLEEEIAGPIGDPKEKIRTYNVPQDRATDHRCNLTIHPLADVLAGLLDPFFDALNE